MGAVSVRDKRSHDEQRQGIKYGICVPKLRGDGGSDAQGRSQQDKGQADQCARRLSQTQAEGGEQQEYPQEKAHAPQQSIQRNQIRELEQDFFYFDDNGALYDRLPAKPEFIWIDAVCQPNLAVDIGIPVSFCLSHIRVKISFRVPDTDG